MIKGKGQKVVSGQWLVVSGRIKTNSFFLLCVLCVLCGNLFPQVLPLARPESVGMWRAKLDQIEAIVNQDIAAKKLPGAVVIVGRKGKIVYRKAFGNRSLVPTVEKMTIDTIFDAAKMIPPRKNVNDGDDPWKWTIRSTANRPILRFDDGVPVVVEASQSDHGLKGSLAFMAGDGNGQCPIGLRRSSALWSGSVRNRPGETSPRIASLRCSIVVHRLAGRGRPTFAILAPRRRWETMRVITPETIFRRSENVVVAPLGAPDYSSYLLIFAGMTIGHYRRGGGVYLIIGAALMFGCVVSFAVISATQPPSP